VTVATDVLPEWLALELSDVDAAARPVPEVPDWLLEAPSVLAEPEPVRWAVPGVWDDEQPTVGTLVRQVQDAVTALERVEPSTVPAARALAEAEALQDVQRRLRVLGLARDDDVRTRALYAAAGFGSHQAWRGTVAPDAPAGDPALARALPRSPDLHQAVLTGQVSLAGARTVSAALGRMRPYLDSRDGLIDGVDAEAVVTAVVGNVVDLVCRDRFGLQPDPAKAPAQAALLADLEAGVARIVASGGSQTARVEQALVLLAQHLHPSRLTVPLDELLLALVPSLLEEREKTAQQKRALSHKRNPDGTWDLRATLTPEAGEQLHTALAAEARRDPANPDDTHARARRRARAAQAAGGDAWADTEPAEPWEHNPDLLTSDGDQLVPRSPSVRLHDAFARLLTRYLSTGLGGRHGKVPVQVTVTVSERTLTGAPGAPPARGSTGQPLARSLLRRWWCDAHVTTLLLDRGYRPLGIVHSARTVTGTELTALRVQHDNRCAGLGCCPGQPDPLIPLVPHHVQRHADSGTTTLTDTVLACERLHQDLHLGKKTIRLRDGRLLNEAGWVTDP
jgi:hypothetical protein